MLGGYWFYNKPWGRYLHIIGLKSTNPDPNSRAQGGTPAGALSVPAGPVETQRRYNYIVHPLAYRGDEEGLPDNSVDAMQWCICNANNKDLNQVPIEVTKTTPLSDVEREVLPLVRAFDDSKPLERWGDKCHGVEVYNDFT